MSADKKYKIIDGPSAEVLFLALQYAYGPTEMTVAFTLELEVPDDDLSFGKQTRQKARVTGVSHEDQSGSSYNLALYLLTDKCNFHGHYRAKNESNYCFGHLESD